MDKCVRCCLPYSRGGFGACPGCVDDLNAKIAELEAEVALLEDYTDRCRCAELVEEVERLRRELETAHEELGLSRSTGG